MESSVSVLKWRRSFMKISTKTSRSVESLPALQWHGLKDKVWLQSLLGSLEASESKVARSVVKRILSMAQDQHCFDPRKNVEELLVPIFEILTSKAVPPRLHQQVLCLLEEVLKIHSVPANLLLHYVYPVLVFLKSEDDRTWMAAVSLLCHLAHLSDFIREMIVDAGGIHYLLRKISHSSSLQMVRNITKILYAYRKDQMILPDGDVSELLPVLFLLVHHPDTVVLRHVCGTVGYLTNIFNSRSGEVIEAGFVPLLTSLLHSPDFLVVRNALQAISNIVSSNATNLDNLPIHSLLPILKRLIQRPQLKKEVLTILASVLTFGEVEVGMVLESTLVEDLMQVALLGSEAEDLQILASIAIKNLTLVASQAQLYAAIHLGFIKVACSLLRSHLNELVYNGLEILEYILEGCHGERPLVDTLLLAQGGHKTLARLSRHTIPDIRYLSKTILKMLPKNKS